MKMANVNALPVSPWRPKVKRKTFSSDRATLAWSEFEPGHDLRPHRHPHEQITYILQGQMRMHVGGESVLLGPGDIMVIPPNIEHFAEAVGPERVLDMSVFSPRRDDLASGT